MKQIEPTIVTCHADAESGCPVITVMQGDKLLKEVRGLQYQVPLKLKHDGNLYVAFSEYYDGSFEPYTVYLMTKLEGSNR